MVNIDILDQTLAISYRPIDSLIPYKGNPRTHSKKQIQQIANSIKQFGFTNPILIDDKNNVIAGHGRIAAANAIGVKNVPTILFEHMSEAQKRAYIIADNKLAENAGWDKELLKIEFEYLMDFDNEFDLSITGFEIAEIDQILDFDEPTAEEEKFSVPEEAVSQPGDVWLLGKHRIICGNALDRDVLNTLMVGQKAQMVFTDPPYNVPVAGHVCSTKHKEFMMASGEMSESQFKDFLSKIVENLIIHSVDGSIHYICMDWRHIEDLLIAGKQYKEFKNLCVWNKTNGGMGSLYRSKHEFVFVFKNGVGPHINNIELGKHGRYRTNVWDYAGANTFSEDRDENLALHPTVKPIQMVADAMLDCSKRGGIVLDLFGGSGTTLLAAYKTKRIAYLVELNPIYVDVTLARYKKITGKEAIHEKTGETFSSIKNTRS